MGTDFSNIGTDFSKLGTDFSAIGTDFRGKGTSFASTEQMYLSQEETLDGHTSAWKDGRMEITKLYGNTDDQAKGVGDEVVNIVPTNWEYSRTISGLTLTMNADHSLTLNGTATATAYIIINLMPQSIVGHKYYFRLRGQISEIQLYNDGGGITTLSENPIVRSATAAKNTYIRVPSGMVCDNLTLTPEIVDLTATKWSDCTTADEFAQRLGFADASKLPAFPYGSSYSAKVTMTPPSRNLWDEKWEAGDIDASTGENFESTTRWRTKNFVPITEGKPYYIVAPTTFAIRGRFYDKDKNYIGYTPQGGGDVRTNTIQTPPAGACYLRFTPNNFDYQPPYKGGICVNLSDSDNGKYTPYIPPKDYPFIFNAPLNKIGDLRDWADTKGNEYHALGVVDLGTLNFQYNLSTGRSVFYAYPVNMACPEYFSVGNARCALYKTVSQSKSWVDKDMAINIDGKLSIVNNEYTDAASFKAAMQGVMLVYELATPTTTKAIAWSKPSFPVTLDTLVTVDSEVKPSMDVRYYAKDTVEEREGSPLNVLAIKEKKAKNYTLFGNTDANAKGVGDEVMQMVDKSNFIKEGDYTYNGITYNFDKTTGRISVSGTSTARSNTRCTILGIPYIQGHKILVKGCPKGGSRPTYNIPIVEYKDNQYKTVSDYEIGDCVIFTAKNSETNLLVIEICAANTAGQSVSGLVFTPQFFDLTDIFGAGNEPATADEFAQRKGWKDASSLPAFPYGSSFVAPIRVGSRNLLDLNAWAQRAGATVEGSTVSKTGSVTRVVVWENTKGYDGQVCASYDEIDISVHSVFFAIHYADGTVESKYPWGGSQVGFVSERGKKVDYIEQSYGTFGAWSVSNMQIEYGNTATPYEPYFAPTLYPSVLSSPLHKIGDIVDYKESTGKEWHGCGVVDLGSLNWLYSASYGFYASFAELMRSGTTIIPYVICSKYSTFSGTSIGQLGDKQITGCSGFIGAGQTSINIKDSDYTSASAFKGAMQGVMLVYALATPTEVQGEPLPKIVVPAGKSQISTETDVQPSNIKAKI